MPVIQLASFPNSRVKPRPVRSTGNTSIVTVAQTAVTLVVPANPNRVDVLVRNLDSALPLYYGYENNIDDQVGANGGFRLDPGQTVKIDDPRDVFIFNPNVANINISVDQGEG